jgi:hypothetical protein
LLGPGAGELQPTPTEAVVARGDTVIDQANIVSRLRGENLKVFANAAHPVMIRAGRGLGIGTDCG